MFQGAHRAPLSCSASFFIFRFNVLIPKSAAVVKTFAALAGVLYIRRKWKDPIPAARTESISIQPKPPAVGGGAWQG